MTLPWWALVVALVAWSAGIMTALLLSPLAPWLILAIVLTLGAVVLQQHHAVVGAIGLCMFLAGACRGFLAPPATLPAPAIGQLVTVAGAIDDDPMIRHNGTRLVVAVDRLLLNDGRRFAHLRVLTTLFGTAAFHYGDYVLLTGKLEEAARFEQFDYRTYLSDQGIGGILQSPRLVRLTAQGGDPLHSWLFKLRHAVVDAVDRALPEPQAALLLGVVFGYRAALPAALQQQMINSGLIHIVVVSGLKVSLLARIVQQGVGRMAPRAAPTIALGAMVVYALLAGASAAALRAAAMGGLVVLAGALRRDTHVYTSMALAAAVMLGLKPALAHDVSFQLSFAGTLGIASMTDAIAARLMFLPTLVRDPFAATIAAEAATWPLMLANFHQVSLIAPVANALVLPLLPAIMVVGGGGALIGSLVATAGWPALQAAGAVASWFRLVIEITASLPMAALQAPYFPTRWIAAAALLNGGVLAGFRLRQFFWQKRVWATLAGGALIIMALLLARPDGRVHVYALDIGTGSAVLVRTGNGEQVLFDGGPDPDKFAQAIGRALPPTARSLKVWVITGGRLQQLGAEKAVLDRFHVDRLLIADPDPWTPTLRALVEQATALNVPVETSAGSLRIDGVTLTPVADERSWLIQAGDADLAILAPDSQWSPSRTIIFTGGGPPTWDAPSPPSLAVVEVNAHSRDGLPAHALLQGLRGTQVLRTDRLGTVELTANGPGFESGD